MRKFNVRIEKEGSIFDYEINADKIEYTTQAVCLMNKDDIVAYFKRDYVVSIVEETGSHNGNK